MEITQPLTTSQRRQIVEHIATECAQEMPSDDMPKAEFFQDLHVEEYRLKAMKSIERVIPEGDWTLLVAELVAHRSFDRDPEGTLEAAGHTGVKPSEIDDWKEKLNDEISALIDRVARFK